MFKKLLKTQWTKILISVVIGVAIIDLQLTYILAFLNNGEIAETLSVALATEILGVTLGYCFKSYKETKSEKDNDLKRELHKNDNSDSVG